MMHIFAEIPRPEQPTDGIVETLLPYFSSNLYECDSFIGLVGAEAYSAGDIRAYKTLEQVGRNIFVERVFVTFDRARSNKSLHTRSGVPLELYPIYARTYCSGKGRSGQFSNQCNVETTYFTDGLKRCRKILDIETYGTVTEHQLKAIHDIIPCFKQSDDHCKTFRSILENTGDIIDDLNIAYTEGGEPLLKKWAGIWVDRLTSRPTDPLSALCIKNPAISVKQLSRFANDTRRVRPAGNSLVVEEEPYDVNNNQEVKETLDAIIRLLDHEPNSDMSFTVSRTHPLFVFHYTDHRCLNISQIKNIDTHHDKTIFMIGSMWLNLFPDAQSVKIETDWEETIRLTTTYSPGVSVVHVIDRVKYALGTTSIFYEC